MADPAVVTYQLPTLTASALATSQAATSLAIGLNVTTVLGTNQRRVVIGSAGADSSGGAFKIVGLNQAGNTIGEIVPGGNATTVATSALDYIRVISVTPVNLTTGALYTTAGSVTVGGSNSGGSLWYIVNWNATPVNIAVSGAVISANTGVVYSVQYCYDDPNDPPAGTTAAIATAPVLPFTLPSISSYSTSVDGYINEPVTAVRLLVNSGSGTVRGTFIQAGMGSP